MRLWSTFRTRSTTRDAETDRDRAARLTKAIAAIIDEMRAERAGLARRFQAASSDAGFAAETLDNGDHGPAMRQRVDDLTATIRACEARLATLAGQIDGLEALSRQAEEYAAASLGTDRTAT